jgi:hypothetical protein
MSKRTLIVIVLFALLLTGCVTFRVETKIKSDGSGTKSFLVAIDKEMMSMVESMGEDTDTSGQDLWESARLAAASIKGAKVEDYRDDDREGVKIVVPFKDAAELQALSANDLFQGSDTVTLSESGEHRTLRAMVAAGDFAGALGQTQNTDLEGTGLEGFDLGDIDFEYSYIVEVDGDIVSYSPKNIATQEGSKVIWDMTKTNSETTELVLTWKPGGGPDLLVIGLVAVVAGGVLLALGGLVLWLRERAA